MLTNKYLKYNPSITFEIFQSVWDKLIANGWKATCDFVSVHDRFREFKNGEMLYNDNPDRKTFYVNYKDIKNYMEDSNRVLTETTVQEILGDVSSDGPIKKWSVDTYVVFLKDYGGHSKGTVDKIIADNNPMNVKVSLPFDGSNHCNLSKSHEAKWFATKSEADEFAKTIIEESIKESVKESVKFVVGNWYQYNSSVYLKYMVSFGNQFRCSERIVDGIHSKIQCSYDSKRCQEINIELIQRYLPTNHPDKISNLSFKIGDWIVLGGDLSHGGYSPGDLFQIHSLQETCFSAKAKNSNEIKIGFSYNMNRHATPEEIKQHLLLMDKDCAKTIEKHLVYDIESYPSSNDTFSNVIVKQYFPVITEIIE